MENLKEAMQTYGEVIMGQPPSPCFSECSVMHDQIPKEHKNPELSAKLEAFRLAVTLIAEHELMSPGAIEQMRSTDKDKLPGLLQDLHDDSFDRAFHCAGQVALGACRVLDIVVHEMNNMPVYTTTNATENLFRAVIARKPNHKPRSYYYSPENTRFAADESGTIQAKPIEKPPRPTANEVNQDIKNVLRRRGVI